MCKVTVIFLSFVLIPFFSYSETPGFKLFFTNNSADYITIYVDDSYTTLNPMASSLYYKSNISNDCLEIQDLEKDEIKTYRINWNQLKNASQYTLEFGNELVIYKGDPTYNQLDKSIEIETLNSECQKRSIEEILNSTDTDTENVDSKNNKREPPCMLAEFSAYIENKTITLYSNNELIAQEVGDMTENMRNPSFNLNISGSKKLCFRVLHENIWTTYLLDWQDKQPIACQIYYTYDNDDNGDIYYSLFASGQYDEVITTTDKNGNESTVIANMNVQPKTIKIAGNACPAEQ